MDPTTWNPPAANTRSRSRVTQSPPGDTTQSAKRRNGRSQRKTSTSGRSRSTSSHSTGSDPDELLAPYPVPSVPSVPGLPSPLEAAVYLIYPLILALGSLFAYWTVPGHVWDILLHRLEPFQAADSSSDPSVVTDPKTLVHGVSGQNYEEWQKLLPYFAQKGNPFNLLFAKKAWAWTTVAFVIFLLTSSPSPSAIATAAKEAVDEDNGHRSPKTRGRRASAKSPNQKEPQRTDTARDPSAVEDPLAVGSVGRGQAWLRFALITGWWFLVTQWCFGPALIDRSFRWTGGRCDIPVLSTTTTTFPTGADSQEDSSSSPSTLEETHVIVPSTTSVYSGLACKSMGGQWHGGHDISGHVFIMVLSSGMLLQEALWLLFRRAGWRMEDRVVVRENGLWERVNARDIFDGFYRAHAHCETVEPQGIFSTVGAKVVAIVVSLDLFMLLMTAMYFHTWVEKITGFVTASIGLYAVYILPRVFPSVRKIVGIPGEVHP